MTTNTKLLKYKMMLHNDTITTLANYLGLNRVNVSAKINGKREFKQSEIARIVVKYKLTYDEIMEIFFKSFFRR